MSTQLQQLAIKGKVLTDGDAEYDNARKVWNGMIDRKPALIAQCTNADDICECVRFARKNNMIVSVKGGGHNVAGNAVCDGGLMIDLSKMKEIKVDVANKTATALPIPLSPPVTKAVFPSSLRLPFFSGSSYTGAGIILLSMPGLC